MDGSEPRLRYYPHVTCKLCPLYLDTMTIAKHTLTEPLLDLSMKLGEGEYNTAPESNADSRMRLGEFHWPKPGWIRSLRLTA